MYVSLVLSTFHILTLCFRVITCCTCHHYDVLHISTLRTSSMSPYMVIRDTYIIAHCLLYQCMLFWNVSECNRSRLGALSLDRSLAGILLLTCISPTFDNTVETENQLNLSLIREEWIYPFFLSLINLDFGVEQQAPDTPSSKYVTDDIVVVTKYMCVCVV